ncbi:MAG: hypothetical protein ACKPKO_21065, partial [Candidatus Fonsibacter sp.]
NTQQSSNISPSGISIIFLNSSLGNDRVIPNAPYYRSVVDRRHPQPQPLASVTEFNNSNRRHYIC